MSDYIPEDIIVQFLKRLPAKSLLRFRCVCQKWKEVIDSPSLVVDHLALQKPRTIVVNNVNPDVIIIDPQTMSCPFEDTPPKNYLQGQFEVMGTLHGIICYYTDRYFSDGIYLWNPSIHRLLNIPFAEFMHYYRSDNYPCAEGFSQFAFWIDPCTKHFKIIICKLYQANTSYGAIYSSIVGDWREISISEMKCITIHKMWSSDLGLVMEGIAYWRCSCYYVEPEKRYFRGGEQREIALLISYDFEQEKFDIIEGPSVIFSEVLTYPAFWNWKGNLSFLYLELVEERCRLYSRQEGSWVNLFTIDLTANLRHCDIFRVYCLLNEVDENKILADTYDSKLVLVDITMGTCVTFQTADDMSYFTGRLTYGFVESLVFP